MGFILNMAITEKPDVKSISAKVGLNSLHFFRCLLTTSIFTNSFDAALESYTNQYCDSHQEKQGTYLHSILANRNTLIYIHHCIIFLQMKVSCDIKSGSSKPITLKNLHNRGYIFMFCSNVTLDTYAFLSHISENLPQTHCHGNSHIYRAVLQQFAFSKKSAGSLVAFHRNPAKYS